MTSDLCGCSLPPKPRPTAPESGGGGEAGGEGRWNLAGKKY